MVTSVSVTGSSCWALLPVPVTAQTKAELHTHMGLGHQLCDAQRGGQGRCSLKKGGVRKEGGHHRASQD